MNQPVSLATRQRFELDFFIASTDWQGAFDRLEVWRSRLTAEGPYEALHADTWSSAVLPPGAVSPASGTGPSVFISGLTLELLVGETQPVVVTFTGTNPLTFAQAATQIAAQSGGLLSSYVFGKTLVIATVQAGALAVLRVTGGGAAPLLGLASVEPGSLAFGQDARIILKVGQEQYGFVDPNGLSTYFYKIRFFNSTTRLTSAFSAPFQGLQAQGISQTNLVRSFVDLVDLEGNPLVNAEVLVGATLGGVQIEGKSIVGGNVRLLTDSAGHAELLLPRGAAVVVSIPGTTLARDVVVPVDPAVQSINLLSPDVGTDDLFTVQVPKLDYAVRRTL